jgi:hypothetical protein
MLPGANRGFRIEPVGRPLVDQRRFYSTRCIHCREGRAGPADRFAGEDGLGSMPWMGGPLRLGSRARTRLVRRIVSTIVGADGRARDDAGCGKLAMPTCMASWQSGPIAMISPLFGKSGSNRPPQAHYQQR